MWNSITLFSDNGCWIGCPAMQPLRAYRLKFSAGMTKPQCHHSFGLIPEIPRLHRTGVSLHARLLRSRLRLSAREHLAIGTAPTVAFIVVGKAIHDHLRGEVDIFLGVLQWHKDFGHCPAILVLFGGEYDQSIARPRSPGR